MENEMSEGAVWIDGVLQPAQQARVSVFDRGFLYGDSAFEVMRTYDKRPFREAAHVERLRRSCERLLIALPRSDRELSEIIASAIAASDLPECYVRVMVTRGVGPMNIDLAQATQPSILVFALTLTPLAPSVYANGIAVGLSRAARATDGTRAVGAKTSNYLGSVLALHEVKQRGAQEALILGPTGEVIEGATSNVFVVRGGELLTPPIDAGILAGITRQTVLEVAAEQALPVRETQLHPSDLYQADEVFITSTVREVVPVVRVDDKLIRDGRPGAVTARVLAGYRAQTRR
jgi:branched-chain amino acid aminotransferase